MANFAQPIVQMAPSAPISLNVQGGQQLEMTTAGSAGAVATVNGKAGAVTVTMLITASGNTVTMGAGVPVKPTGADPLAGDAYHRTDTPAIANQRLYVCTTGGAAPVWSGIA